MPELNPTIDKYICWPYSHPDPEIRELRFRECAQFAAKLAMEGYVVIAPIAHSHPLAIYGGLRGDWDSWRKQDEAFIRASKEVLVPKVRGWDTSVGIRAEIDFARSLGIPVVFQEMGEEHDG